MTNYVIDKEKAKAILLQHLISEGVDITKLTFEQTYKFTDEVIESMINVLPIDSLLDQGDEVTKRTVGYTSKEMMDRKEHEEKGGDSDGRGV